MLASESGKRFWPISGFEPILFVFREGVVTSTPQEYLKHEGPCNDLVYLVRVDKTYTFHWT